ncbi:MAG: carboxypeptidase regulatory-like domain-containing protein, partial [Anaerolineae bacterium]
GTISAAENGEPLPSIKVNLYQVDMQDEEKILVDSTYSDDVGQYNFADVEANYTYIVVAEKDLDSPWWQANREFLDETSGLLHIQNGVASVIDFSLEKGGTITGQIVDSSTNQPISRVSIDIFEKVIQDKGVGFNRITTVETDEEGNYRSIGLESNDYVLTFNYYYGNGETFYQPEVFDDEPLISKLGDFDLNTPTPVSVLQGVETVLNEELTPPPISTGIITGVVSGSSEVVSDFYIELYKNTEKGLKVVYGGIYLPDSPVELLKDNEGYQLTGIPDGDYYLKVIPQRDFLTFENSEEDAADYRETWYGGTQHWEESQMVSIVNGNTVSNVDIDLELGSRLFGTFSVGTAFPFNSNQVRVNEVKFYNHDGEFLFDGVVRDDFVDVQGLWPGEYYLYFPTYEHRVLGNGNSRTFYGEWYGDASSLESSTPLIVTGEEESFIKLDVALALDNPPPSLPDQPPAENIHKVSGTVTADGEPLLGVTITTDNGATTVTDSNGDYSLYLKDGSHTLTPSKNGYTFSPADLSVTVNGADLSGQNFTATALPTGSLSGIITEDDSSIPLEGVDVLAYEQNGAAWQFAQIATTDENGAYQLSDLVAAKYKLLFRVVSKTHKSEYYDNASSFSQGVAISLASGGSATDIHASLKKRPEAAIIAEGIDQFTDPESGEVTLTAGRGENNSVTISRNVSCESGDPADVQLIIGSSAFEMSDSGNGAYSATLNIPGDVTSDSTQNMSVQYVCNGFTETVSVGELVLYDPSGVITDAETDEPIIGASVTLYRVAGASPDTGSTTNECRTIDTRPVPVSGLPFGAWSGVPAADISAGHPVDAAFDTLNGQSLFSPAIPTQVTGEDGKYGWDVAEGCWYVVVEAEGFDTLVSPMVGVPPAVLDLDIALSKPAPPPPPPPISFDILLPLIGR